MVFFIFLRSRPFYFLVAEYIICKSRCIERYPKSKVNRYIQYLTAYIVTNRFVCFYFMCRRFFCNTIIWLDIYFCQTAIKTDSHHPVIKICIGTLTVVLIQIIQNLIHTSSLLSKMFIRLFVLFLYSPYELNMNFSNLS